MKLPLFILFILLTNLIFCQNTKQDSIEIEQNGVIKKFSYSDIAYIYTESGIDEIKTGKYTEAVSDFETALSYTPDNSDIYYYIGLAYYFLKDFENSIIRISQAIEINNNNIDYYQQRGVSYSSIGRYDEALADFEKMLEIDPQSSDANVNIGSMYLLTEDYETACKYLSKAAEAGNEKAQYLTEKYCKEKE